MQIEDAFFMNVLRRDCFTTRRWKLILENPGRKLNNLVFELFELIELFEQKKKRSLLGAYITLATRHSLTVEMVEK